MTQADIERMAREAGFTSQESLTYFSAEFTRFAALVRAQALEDAARAAEERPLRSGMDEWDSTAASIRALKPGTAAQEPDDAAEDLYDRLHSLSKSLESSGRLDEHDNPGAYATVLDAMNYVRRGTVAT